MNNIFDSKKIATFVPCFGTGNRGFYNSSFYYDDMYIDFQLCLIDKFSSLLQYDFIIKCLKTRPFPQFSEIIRDWIYSKSYSNIIYRKDKLTNSLALSQKVIIDYPSSAVLESEKLKVNTLVLYYKGLKIRDTAQASLKYVQLKKFQDINDGIEIVVNFLQEN